jgi:capsule polysaccharide export protein KpsE/RkpR
MTENNNLLPLLKTWAKWRKAIFLICITTGIVTAAISYFSANYYKSTTIFYPASSDVQKPEKLFGYGGETMYYYGNAEDVDRVLSIGESEELKDFLIQRFALYQHYGVDSTTGKGHFLVREILGSQFTVQKNRYDAIELIVEDTDPKVAQAMAKTAREKMNEMSQQLIRNNQVQIIHTFEKSLETQQKELSKLEDSLQVIRSNFGIYNTITQSKMLTDLSAIAEARLARTSAQVAALEREPNASRDTIIMMRSLVKGLQNEVAQLKKGSGGTSSFNKGVGIIEILTQIHEQTRKQFSFDVVRVAQVKATLASNVSSLYVVEEARIADMKSRPKRMIIVAAAILAAFIFSTIGILLFENYKNIDWENLKD